MGTQSASGRPAKPLLVGPTPTPCSKTLTSPRAPNNSKRLESRPPQGNVQDAGEPKAKPVGRDQIHRDLLQELVDNLWLLNWDDIGPTDKAKEFLDRVEKSLEDSWQTSSSATESGSLKTEGASPER